jgi:Amt family ammonium transporter
MDATLIGGISGIIIVFGVSFIDKIHLDDPVGAIAVHLFCGIWGTLAVGIFGDLAGINQLISQLVGIISYAIICISSSLIIFFTLNKTIGIRVSIKEEIEGLDMHEHGMNAYHE